MCVSVQLLFLLLLPILFFHLPFFAAFLFIGVAGHGRVRARGSEKRSRESEHEGNVGEIRERERKERGRERRARAEARTRRRKTQYRARNVKSKVDRVGVKNRPTKLANRLPRMESQSQYVCLSVRSSAQLTGWPAIQLRLLLKSTSRYERAFGKLCRTIAQVLPYCSRLLETWKRGRRANFI